MTLTSYAGWFFVGVLSLVAVVAMTSVESALGVVLPISGIGIGASLLALLLCVSLLYRQSRWRHWRIMAALASCVTIALGAMHSKDPVCRDFTTLHGQVRLAGTACYPSGNGTYRTAILVHGSGRETRAEYLFYAKFLARRGIAAIAYDKRGSGISSGDTYAGTYADYAADAATEAAWAATQPFARQEKIGFVGFSEAEWVVPQAARLFSPAFIVLVGGSGLSPLGQVSEEISIRLEKAGFGRPEIGKALAINDSFAAYLRGASNVADFREVLESNQGEAWYKAAGKLPDRVYARTNYAWWIRVMDFSPQSYWIGIKSPILLIKGGKDDHSRSVESVARLLNMAGANTHVDSKIFPGADHAMVQWPLGKGIPPPFFPDGYPDIVATWINHATN